MSIFFGTDGIRGKVTSELNFDLAFKCGNALGSSLDKPKILIGRDTRVSGSYITTAFAGGAITAGANVYDVGICPTPAIAYLTKILKCDYGVMISASHNPYDYNGIKIFDKNGHKINDNQENILEKRFVHTFNISHNNLGKYEQKFNFSLKYVKYLLNFANFSLKDKKIVIDASNGSNYKFASYIYKKLGAKVISLNCKNDGININNKCGSLYPENLVLTVLKENADFGFAFDGDADRIIAVDEKGEIIDGDLILFALAKYLKNKNSLNKNTVVGTRHTNMAIEENLKNYGINFIRTDIGDKYVIEQMEKDNLSLGGEKSGHIIISKYATTGDGLLTSLFLSKMIVKTQKPLSTLCKIKLYPQINIDCPVQDKMRVINSEKLSNEINNQEKILKNNGRIMVRVSGTEPKIRIMVEAKDEKVAKEIAKNLQEIIIGINSIGV